MPEHKRAFASNGCVYEHLLVAEKMLKRELKEGEVVHHKDRNRSNNSPENLMVFKTKADHTAYHNGMEVYLDGDVWVAKHVEHICPICNKNKKHASSTMCAECEFKKRAMNIPSREKVEELIYKYPFTQIGKMYGVSDNAVRKWCKKYNLPYKKSEINKLNNN